MPIPDKTYIGMAWDDDGSLQSVISMVAATSLAPRCFSLVGASNALVAE